jgi:hypothetical protein
VNLGSGFRVFADIATARRPGPVAELPPDAHRGQRGRAALQAELPTPVPPGESARAIRLEMLERGLALVETPRFFDGGLFPDGERSRTVWASYGHQWWKFPRLAEYGRWLERLLGQALPEESLALAGLEFRQEPAGTEHKEVDRLHADGSYLRSVCTLYGPTTVYRVGKAERSVPCGQTLLMTALGRARALGLPCTLHRRPGAGPERAVIVGSFEPRRKRPRPAQGPRRVARTRG